MSRTRDYINGILGVLTNGGGGGGGGGFPDADADDIVYGRRNNSWTRAMGFNDNIVAPVKTLLTNPVTTSTDVENALLTLGGKMGMLMLLDSNEDRLEMFSSATAMKLFATAPNALRMLSNNAGATADFIASTALTTKNSPLMTSNTAPSGVASASSIYSDAYAAWHAFDRNTNYWCSASGQGTNQWVKYDFGVGNSTFAHTLILTMSSDGHPAVWRIECSNDNAQWDVIKSFTATVQSNTTYTLTLSKTGKYRYWRVFLVSSISQNYLAIDELIIRGFTW